MGENNLEYTTGILIGDTGSGENQMLQTFKAEPRTSLEGINIYRINYENRYSFDLIKCLGTDRLQNSVNDVEKIRLSLISYPINSIFIVMKLDTRFERMIDLYMETESLVERYKERIVIIIINPDSWRNHEDISKSLQEGFKEYCQNIIFFSPIFDDSENLAYSMANFMGMNDKVSLNLSEDFKHNFQINEEERKNIEVSGIIKIIFRF